MTRRLALAALVALWPALASAQFATIGPTPPTADNGDRLATTAFVKSAIGSVLPTPTQAGDLIYWNGSAWVTIAGNNSGTRFLREDSSGVPSWVAAAGVTQVICGTGLSGGTITTSGTCAVNLTTANNSLGANVAMNNTANYFDGPSVAQGVSGTWFASGTVAVGDTAGSAAIFCKLWDGTTVIASIQANTPATSFVLPVALSGVITSPAGNVRISCRDSTSTSGLILFNGSGNSKDSTVTAIRIN